MDNGKKKRRRIDPEERARWAEAREQLAEMIARTDERIARRKEAEARRRQRLRRFTFGLVGREENDPAKAPSQSP